MAIEQIGQPPAQRIDAADDLGNPFGGEAGIAGVFTLGAEGEEEVFARSQAAGCQYRQHHVAGRARIGRALQDDQLAGAKHLDDFPGGLLDKH